MTNCRKNGKNIKKIEIRNKFGIVFVSKIVNNRIINTSNVDIMILYLILTLGALIPLFFILFCYDDWMMKKELKKLKIGNEYTRTTVFSNPWKEDDVTVVKIVDIKSKNGETWVRYCHSKHGGKTIFEDSFEIFYIMYIKNPIYKTRR